MCICFCSWCGNDKYKLILMFNRDEIFSRETIPIGFNLKSDDVFEDYLFFPLDIISGGTFFCLNVKNGNFSLLLNNNFKNIPYNPNPKFKRADLPINFCKLGEEEDHSIFINDINTNKMDYNGFNLLFGNMNEEKIFYYTNNALANKNREVEFHKAVEVTDKLFGLSNCFIENTETVHFQKVELGKKKLSQLLQSKFEDENVFIQKLFDIMEDETKLEPRNFEKVKLLKEGIATQFNQIKQYIVSSIFVSDNVEGINLEFGTRHTFVLTLDYKNNLTLYEKFDEILCKDNETSQFNENIKNKKTCFVKAKRQDTSVNKYNFEL